MLIIGNTVEDDDDNNGETEDPHPPVEMKKTVSMTRDPQKLVPMVPSTMLKSNSLQQAAPSMKKSASLHKPGGGFNHDFKMKPASGRHNT